MVFKRIHMILLEGRNNHLCTTRRNAAHMGNSFCRAQAVCSSSRCYLFIVVGRVGAPVSTKADGRMPGREAMDIAVCRGANADVGADRRGTDSATPISNEKAQHRAPDNSRVCVRGRTVAGTLLRRLHRVRFATIMRQGMSAQTRARLVWRVDRALQRLPRLMH